MKSTIPTKDLTPISQFGLNRKTPKVQKIRHTVIFGPPGQGKSCATKALVAFCAWLRVNGSPYVFPADTQVNECILPKDAIIVANGQVPSATKKWIKGKCISICFLGTESDEHTVEDVIKQVNDSIRNTPQYDRPNYWFGTKVMLKAIEEAKNADYVVPAMKSIEHSREFLLKFFGIDATLKQIKIVLTDVRLTELYTGLLLAKPPKGNNKWHIPMLEAIREYMNELLGPAPITHLNYEIENSDNSAASADSASAGP